MLTEDEKQRGLCGRGKKLVTRGDTPGLWKLELRTHPTQEATPFSPGFCFRRNSRVIQEGEGSHYGKREGPGVLGGKPQLSGAKFSLQASREQRQNLQKYF